MSNETIPFVLYSNSTRAVIDYADLDVLAATGCNAALTTGLPSTPSGVPGYPTLAAVIAHYNIRFWVEISSANHLPNNTAGIYATVTEWMNSPVRDLLQGFKFQDENDWKAQRAKSNVHPTLGPGYDADGVYYTYWTAAWSQSVVSGIKARTNRPVWMNFLPIVPSREFKATDYWNTGADIISTDIYSRQVTQLCERPVTDADLSVYLGRSARIFTDHGIYPADGKVVGFIYQAFQSAISGCTCPPVDTAYIKWQFDQAEAYKDRIQFFGTYVWWESDSVSNYRIPLQGDDSTQRDHNKAAIDHFHTRATWPVTIALDYVTAPDPPDPDPGDPPTNQDNLHFPRGIWVYDEDLTAALAINTATGKCAVADLNCNFIITDAHLSDSTRDLALADKCRPLGIRIGWLIDRAGAFYDTYDTAKEESLIAWVDALKSHYSTWSYVMCDQPDTSAGTNRIENYTQAQIIIKSRDHIHETVGVYSDYAVNPLITAEKRNLAMRYATICDRNVLVYYLGVATQATTAQYQQRLTDWKTLNLPLAKRLGVQTPGFWYPDVPSLSTPPTTQNMWDAINVAQGVAGTYSWLACWAWDTISSAPAPYATGKTIDDNPGLRSQLTSVMLQVRNSTSFLKDTYDITYPYEQPEPVAVVKPTVYTQSRQQGMVMDVYRLGRYVDRITNFRALLKRKINAGDEITIDMPEPWLHEDDMVEVYYEGDLLGRFNVRRPERVYRSGAPAKYSASGLASDMMVRSAIPGEAFLGAVNLSTGLGYLSSLVYQYHGPQRVYFGYNNAGEDVSPVIKNTAANNALDALDTLCKQVVIRWRERCDGEFPAIELGDFGDQKDIEFKIGFDFVEFLDAKRDAVTVPIGDVSLMMSNEDFCNCVFPEGGQYPSGGQNSVDLTVLLTTDMTPPDGYEIRQFPAPDGRSYIMLCKIHDTHGQEFRHQAIKRVSFSGITPPVNEAEVVPSGWTKKPKPEDVVNAKTTLLRGSVNYLKQFSETRFTWSFRASVVCNLFPGDKVYITAPEGLAGEPINGVSYYVTSIAIEFDKNGKESTNIEVSNVLDFLGDPSTMQYSDFVKAKERSAETFETPFTATAIANPDGSFYYQFPRAFMTAPSVVVIQQGGCSQQITLIDGVHFEGMTSPVEHPCTTINVMITPSEIQ